MNNYWVINQAKKVHDTSKVYFSIDNYFFLKNEKARKNRFQPILFKFNMKVDEEIDIVSIFNYLCPNSNSGGFNIIGKVPFKTTQLIEKYDDNNNIDDIYLFHEIRTKYIIFGVPEGFESEANGIVFIGVSIFDKQIRFSIKAFNFDIIRDVHEIIIDAIKRNINIESINYITNIKWLLVNKYKILEKDCNRDSLEKKILLDSINCNYEKMYRELFSELMRKGYITAAERKDIAQLKTAEGTRIRNILKKYLKLSVEEGKATLIHDDSAMDAQDDDKNTVYTLSSKGWKYFMNNWFEDYTGQALTKINNFKIEFLQAESEFNFSETKDKNNKMEIDWLLLVEKDGVSKIISIECKRTMTSKKITAIKDKYKDKFLNTPNHYLIDGFINVGCFLPKKNGSSKLKYNIINYDTISAGQIEKPFLTFVADDFKIFCENLEKSIENIFTN